MAIAEQQKGKQGNNNAAAPIYHHHYRIQQQQQQPREPSAIRLARSHFAVQTFRTIQTTISKTDCW